jgi:hypothetical protein
MNDDEHLLRHIRVLESQVEGYREVAAAQGQDVAALAGAALAALASWLCPAERSPFCSTSDVELRDDGLPR